MTPRRIAAVVLAGLALYAVGPALVGVANAWPEAARIEPWWYAAMIAAQVGSLFSLWRLQALCCGIHQLRPVATSQLASGALGRVVPGGAAVQAATQYTMLVRAGVPAAALGTGLTAFALLQFAALCALPLLAIPSVVFRRGASDGLLQAGGIALGLFVAMFVVSVVLLRSDRALDRIVGVVHRISVRLGRDAQAREEVLESAVAQRSALAGVLGRRWPEAIAAAVGRWLLDYLTLFAALAAVGAHPRLSLALLAFMTAQLLAQVPLTPGGIGVVEAGLIASLALAGVGAGEATVATLAYRLVNFWLPLPAGAVAWVLHRRRHGGDDAEAIVVRATG